MDENIYNSLTKKLILNGLINSDIESENFFNIEADEDFSNSPFVEKKEKEEKKQPKKRINRFDLELITNPLEDNKKEGFDKLNNLEKIIFNFFPKLYKAKLAKEAILRLKELNIDTKVLFDKTIPYGESEIRYKDLIKFLKYASEIQSDIEKKV